MNTKLLAALIVVGVLAIAVVGLVAAQAASTTAAPNGTTSSATRNGGFFGWMGRCMGFRSTNTNAYINGTQTPANIAPANVSQQPLNITVTNPNTGTTTTYQGYYSNSYGCGMMGNRP